MPKDTTNIIEFPILRSPSGSAGTDKTCPASRASEGSGKTNKNNDMQDACPVWNKLDKTSLSRSKQSEAQNRKRVVPLSDFEADATLEDIREAIKNRPNELSDLLPSSFSSFCSMNGRGQRGEAAVHRRFHGKKGFGAFLIEMGGPKRRASDSVDQINDQDGYVPGNMRWRSKRGQANNRSTTVQIYDPKRREWGPRAGIARAYGFTPDAVKKAMQRGAEGAHVIEEMRAATKARTSTTSRGKTQPAARGNDATTVSPATPASIPPAPVRMATDPRQRWPFHVTKAQRDEWERLYRENRILRADGYEWRCEYALRAARVNREAAQRRMDKILESWSGFEPTDDEEAVWAEHEAFRDHFLRREVEAAAALPGILKELRAYRRQQKAWSPGYSAPSTYERETSENDDADDYENDDRAEADPVEDDQESEHDPSGLVWGSDLAPETYEFSTPAPEPRSVEAPPYRIRQRAPRR